MCSCPDVVLVKYEGESMGDKFVLQYYKCKECGKVSDPYIQFFTQVVH